jgi:hypothetical protein
MSEFSIRTQPFRIAWADYRALRLSPRFLLPALGFCLLMPLGIGFPSLLRGDITTSLYVGLIALGYSVLAALAGLFIVWRRYRRDPVMSGERLMVLDSGAVRLAAYGCDFRQTWAQFGKVYQDRDRVFLQRRDWQVYIIPKRALASAAEAERLVTLARAAIKAARTGPVELPPLPEAPETREIWRTKPYQVTFALICARLLPALGPILLIVCGLAALFAAIMPWLDGPFGLSGFTLAAVAVAMVLGIAIATFTLTWLIVRRRPHLSLPLNVCFTRDYVRCTSGVFDGRYDWVIVREVRRAPGVFLVHLPRGAYYVPVSAFATRAEAMAFFTQAVAFWRAAEARR